jgi:hypothetical protein
VLGTRSDLSLSRIRMYCISMMDDLQFNTAAERAIDEEVRIELWLCGEAVH